MTISKYIPIYFIISSSSNSSPSSRWVLEWHASWILLPARDRDLLPPPPNPKSKIIMAFFSRFNQRINFFKRILYIFALMYSFNVLFFNLLIFLMFFCIFHSYNFFSSFRFFFLLIAQLTIDTM